MPNDKYRPLESDLEKKAGRQLGGDGVQRSYDPLDGLSGRSPLDRISTGKDPLDRISGGDPLDRISYRRRYYR